MNRHVDLSLRLSHVDPEAAKKERKKEEKKKGKKGSSSKKIKLSETSDGESKEKSSDSR